MELIGIPSLCLLFHGNDEIKYGREVCGWGFYKLSPAFLSCPFFNESAKIPPFR